MDDSVSDQGRAILLRMADRALVNGSPSFGVVDGVRVVCVPDITELEGLSQGMPALPESWTLRRKDGRVVKFFDGSSPRFNDRFRLLGR